MESADTQPQQEQPRVDAYASTAPSLAAKMMDPAFAEAAKNDTGHLAQLEHSITQGEPGFLRDVTGRLLKSPGEVLVDTPLEALNKAVGETEFGKGFKGAALGAPMYETRAKQITGDAVTPEEAAQADKISKMLAANPFKSRYSDDDSLLGLLKQGPHAAGGALGGIFGDLPTMGPLVMGGTGVGAAVGSVVPGLGTAAGGGIGGSLAFASELSRSQGMQTVGQVYEESARWKTPEGRPLDEVTRRGAALATGLAVGAIGALPIFGQLTGKLTPQLLTRALERPGFAAMLGRMAVKFGTAEFTNSAVGVAQELAKVAAEQLATGKPVDNIGKRMTTAAVSGATSGAPFAAIEGVHGIPGPEHVAKTAQDVTTYDNIGETLQATKVFQTDRTHVLSWLEQVAAKNGMKDVTFPRKQFMDFLKSERLSDDVEKVMPDVAKQLKDSEGDDAAAIRLSPKDVAGYVAGAKSYKLLRPDMRVGDNFTLRELNDIAKESQQDAQAPAAPELPANVKAVHEEARAEFQKAFPGAPGEHLAAVYTSGTHALAQAIGADIKEVHGRYGLEVQKKMAAQLDERALGIPGENVGDSSKYNLLKLDEKVPGDDINATNFLDTLRRHNRDADLGKDIKPSGTWQEVFDRLKVTAGSDKQAAAVLARMGYDGLVGKGRNFVWHPDVTLPKQDPFKVKGATEFKPGQTTMSFSEHADIGTALHELGHFFLRAWSEHAGRGGEVELHHASPFAFDKPDIAKVGKGTGFRSHGHGIYASADPGVADMYGADFEAQGHTPTYHRWAIPQDTPLLNEDAPLHEQSESVQAALKQAGMFDDPNATGKELYKSLKQKYPQQEGDANDDAPVSRALNEAGIKGSTHKSEVAGGDGVRKDNYVLYDDKIVRVLKNGEQAKASLKDFAELHKWLGGDEEKFADAFIDKIRSGKSPKPELNPAFGRFRGWLTSLYGTQKALGENIPPQVESVMDKMLGARDAVDKAASALITPMVEPGDLPPGKFDRYQRLLEDAAATAEDELDRQLLSHISGEGIRAFEKAKESVKQELISKDASHSLVSYLKTGERLDGGMLPTDEGKLSTDAVKALGADPATLAQMKDMMGGEADPEHVAKAFGYNDARDMLSTLRDYRPLDTQVAEEAARRMPGWVDPEKWVQGRAVAKMADAVPRVLAMEYEALGGKLPKNAMQVFDAIAKRDVRAMKVSSLSPEQFLAEYKRLGQEAADHKGSPEAMSLKRRQIIEFARWREARQALEEQSKFQALALKMRDDVTLQERLVRAGPEHLQAVQSALSAYGFTEADPSRPSISKYVDDQVRKNNADIILDPQLDHRDTAQTSVENFTVRQLGQARDFLTSLKTHVEQLDEYNGGPTTKLLEPLVASLGQYIRDRWPNIDRSQRNLATRSTTAFGRRLIAEVARAEGIMRTLDGDTHGFLAQTLLQPIVEAEGERHAMLGLVHDALGGIMGEMKEGDANKWMAELTDFQTRDVETHHPVTGEKVFLPRRKLYKSELFSALLMYGNENNRRFIQGGLKVSHAELMSAFQKHLPPEAATYANRIWQLMEAVFPEVQRTYKGRTGVELEGMKAAPLTLNMGGKDVQLTGGYFPKKISAEAVTTRDKTRFGYEGFNTPDIEDSFTEHRTEAFGSPDLSLPSLLGHLSKKVHYATMYNAWRETNKIIQHPEFRKAVSDTIGPEYLKTFDDMMKNVARSGMPDAPVSAWDRVVRWGMNGASAASIHFSAKTALLQPTSLLSTVKDINPVHIASAVKDVMADWHGSWEGAEARSNELGKIDADLKNGKWRLAVPDFTLSPRVEDQLRTLGHGKLFTTAAEAKSYLQEVGVSHVAATRKFANLITFLAAEKHATAEGRPDPTAYGDAVLRQTHGGVDLKDMPNILAHPGLSRGSILFYSTWSAFADQMISAGMSLDKGIRTKGIGGVVSKETLLKTVVPLIAFAGIPATAHMLLDMSWKDKKADEDFHSWFIKQQLSMIASRAVPVGGDVLGQMLAPQQAGHGTLGSGPFSQLSGAVRKIELGVTDPKHHLDPKDVAVAASFLSGVGLNHLYQGLDYFSQLAQGRYGDAGRAYSVFMRGEKKEGIKR